MQPWKRIRLAPDSDAYINPAPDPDPTPAHVPDYAAELDALPPESPDARSSSTPTTRPSSANPNQKFSNPLTSNVFGGFTSS